MWLLPRGRRRRKNPWFEVVRENREAEERIEARDLARASCNSCEWERKKIVCLVIERAYYLLRTWKQKQHPQL